MSRITFNTTTIFFVITLFCLLSSSCKDKQSAVKVVDAETIKQTKSEESTTKASDKVILCFGNSLTAGYGLKDENEGWTYLLQKRIDSLNLDYKVVNAGLSGETTAEGAQRIDWVLNQKVDVFILELGANDMLRGLDVGQTEKNLEDIIAAVKKKNQNIKIVIAGMLAPPSMGATYEKAFNGAFTKIAKKYNAALIPFLLESVAQIPELNLPDGKHPNAKGQKIVLENVWSILQSEL